MVRHDAHSYGIRTYKNRFRAESVELALAPPGGIISPYLSCYGAPTPRELFEQALRPEDRAFVPSQCSDPFVAPFSSPLETESSPLE